MVIDHSVKKGDPLQMRSDGLRDPRDEKGDADTENDDITEKGLT